MRTALRSRALRWAPREKWRSMHFGEVVLTHLAQGFGEVVDDEAVVIGEELVAHLRDLPFRGDRDAGGR